MSRKCLNKISEEALTDPCVEAFSKILLQIQLHVKLPLDLQVYKSKHLMDDKEITKVSSIPQTTLVNVYAMAFIHQKLLLPTFHPQLSIEYSYLSEESRYLLASSWKKPERQQNHMWSFNERQITSAQIHFDFANIGEIYFGWSHETYFSRINISPNILMSSFHIRQILISTYDLLK